MSSIIPRPALYVSLVFVLLLGALVGGCSSIPAGDDDDTAGDDDDSAGDDDDTAGDDDDTAVDDDDSAGDDDDTAGDDDSAGDDDDSAGDDDDSAGDDDDSAGDDDDSAPGDDDDSVPASQCESGPNPPLGKLVFLSSGQPDGNLGGVAGADAYCQSLAQGAGLPGTFMAWLSGSTYASSPAGRFVRSNDLPYVRIDGVVVAQDWTDLTDGSIACPIDRDETGQQVFASGSNVATVLSNTLVDGSPGLTNAQGTALSTCYGTTSCHCYDWTSSDSFSADPPASAVGSVFGWTLVGTTQLPSDWTDYSFLNGCGLNSSSLYCFEQ